MTQYSFPSETFPGPPRVSLELPDDWSPVPVPGAVLAVRGPAAEGGATRPRIVVTHSTRPAGYSVRTALGELRTFVEAQEDGVVDEPFTVEVGEEPVVGVNLSWTDRAAGTMVQVHLFSGVRRAGVVDLVHVMGAVGGEQAEQEYADLHGHLQTLEIRR